MYVHAAMFYVYNLKNKRGREVYDFYFNKIRSIPIQII